jgi:hypothetical protein
MYVSEQFLINHQFYINLQQKDLLLTLLNCLRIQKDQLSTI